MKKKKKTARKVAPKGDVKATKGKPGTNPVGIMDTTLRDGHQCLIATRMRTEDMTAILERMRAPWYMTIPVSLSILIDGWDADETAPVAHAPPRSAISFASRGPRRPPRGRGT